MKPITITKEIIKDAINDADISIQEFDNVSVMRMRINIEHSDNTINFDVISSNAIDYESIIEKMENLGNLKWKMMSNLISSHTLKINRDSIPLLDFFICDHDKDDLFFEHDAMELLEQTANSLNTTLNDAIEVSIEQYFK